MMTSSSGLRLRKGKACSRGFSLIELLVAMAVFLVVSGVSFTLFSQHQALLTQEQVAVGLNIGLRNALAQIQLDVANAGDGLILGTNVPSWPVGVTIINNPTTAGTCNPQPPNPVYDVTCFDQLNIVLVDSNTPALHPCVNVSCTISTSTAGTTAFGLVPNVTNPSTGNPFTAAQLANQFKSGDEVLFIQACAGGGHTSGSSGCMFTTTTLSAAGGTSTTLPGCSPAAPCVTLSFNPTNGGGGNSVCPTPAPSPNTCYDPLNMTSRAPATQLTDQFTSNDWVVRLSPITYSVNATHVDSSGFSDPQLMRTQGQTANVLMDQVIGFKVGAALWNNSNTSSFQYNYNAASYTTGSPPVAAAYQYNLIRSVRVSIIGRTEPNPILPYRNLFDSGPYQIRGNSIVVDPRNLTMNAD